MIARISLVALVCLAGVVWATPALRSIAVKGGFTCGTKAAENVHVRLLRVGLDAKKGKEVDFLKETLDARTTGPSGLFELTGNTNGRAVNETEIVPAIAVYHQCDDKKDTKGFRRVVINVPPKTVTQGRTPKKTHDIGTLNLEISYPGETRDKEFKPVD